MEWNLLFFFNSILLGVGLAMDAFSVSLSNGLNEPHMRVKKMCIIAGTFGFFQAFMPMAGWFCVHTIVEYFKAFEKFIPWIALFLLLYIGGKMVWEGKEMNQTIQELTPLTTYQVYVTAVNERGIESLRSETVEFVTMAQ